MVTELLVRDELGMFDSVLLAASIVLPVSVWVPVKVATVESIAIVTGVEPLKLVPCNPVPIVSAEVVEAVIVPDAPSATVTPLNETELLSSATFGMDDRVFAAPEIDLLASV